MQLLKNYIKMSKIDKSYHKLLRKIIKEGYTYEDKSRGINCKQISSYEFRHNLQTDGFPAITTKKLYWKGVVTELLWFLKGDTNIKYLVDNNVNIWNKDAYNHYKREFDLRYPKSPQNRFDSKEFISLIKESDDKELHQGIKLGDLGPVYGSQWRNSNGVDQFSNLIKELKDNPMSRRHIVNSWSPVDLQDMALPPCHWAFEIIPRPLTLEERVKLSNIEVGATFNEETLDNMNIQKYSFDLKWHQRSVDTFLG